MRTVLGTAYPILSNQSKKGSNVPLCFFFPPFGYAPKNGSLEVSYDNFHFYFMVDCAFCRRNDLTFVHYQYEIAHQVWVKICGACYHSDDIPNCHKMLTRQKRKVLGDITNLPVNTSPEKKVKRRKKLPVANQVKPAIKPVSHNVYQYWAEHVGEEKYRALLGEVTVTNNKEGEMNYENMPLWMYLEWYNSYVPKDPSNILPENMFRDCCIREATPESKWAIGPTTTGFDAIKTIILEAVRDPRTWNAILRTCTSWNTFARSIKVKDGTSLFTFLVFYIDCVV